MSEDIEKHNIKEGGDKKGHSLSKSNLDFEFRVLSSVTRRFPRIRGAAFAANLVKQFYTRRRKPLEVEVLGFRMYLDPNENVDGALLFFPHLYEHCEIEFMKKHLEPGNIFLDVGAHIGFYSLIASRIVRDKGSVIAVEADPFNFERLRLHLTLNDIRNVAPVNEGVSNKQEVLRLGLNVTANRAGNSFLSTNADHLYVPCSSLTTLLKRHRVDRVHGAKLDIEGFEFRVLDQFFKEAEDHLWPDFIIVEQHSELVERAGGNTIELLKSKGYRVECASGPNYMLRRRGPA